jgi:hypothetical protein
VSPAPPKIASTLTSQPADIFGSHLEHQLAERHQLDARDEQNAHVHAALRLPDIRAAR